MTQYYIDNYRSGCERDIRGPYETLESARTHVDGVEVSVAPYEGVVEELQEHGETVTLVEAWARSEDSEDYQAIYAVSGGVQ